MPKSFRDRLLDEKRILVVQAKGYPVTQTYVWIRKYKKQAKGARDRGIEHDLTFKQFMRLAQRAGLTSPEDIGKSPSSYQLGRVGDKGGYTLGNCRFITQRQNLEERRINGGNAEVSRKLTGRNASNDEGRAEVSRKLRGRSKNSHAYLQEQADRQGFGFVIFAPDGTRYKGSNVTEFCTSTKMRKHKLNQANISKMLRGDKPQYKGWTGHYTNQ